MSEITDLIDELYPHPRRPRPAPPSINMVDGAVVFHCPHCKLETTIISGLTELEIACSPIIFETIKRASICLMEVHVYGCKPLRQAEEAMGISR